MKASSLFICFLFLINSFAFTQNVGIGTTTPNAKAALEIQSINKGVLFPRLSSAQRNAITNPPNGLHIFNTDERCLNYYDSVYTIWNCYCETDTCKTVTIEISDDVANIDFYNTYGNKYPGIKKFVILIKQDVYINSTTTAPAFNFTTVPNNGNYTIKIINNGLIYGIGGVGGRGAAGQVGAVCSLQANPGTAGGNAIATFPWVKINIINYGIVAGGGGGGGGGGKSAEGQYGGGGGGGAGLAFGIGGTGGGTTSYGTCIPSCVCGISVIIAVSGTTGTNVVGGAGGAGASGGGNGGNGGNPGQAGFNGTGTASGTGGVPGKAISGGTGNSIINIGGQYFGIVD
ncbi:MAG: hypothetical protein ABIY51_12060 [Ferruginibacter sp.]